MEPPIQYAKTADGVSIAFATLGQGALPLVSLPSLLPELRLLWRIPEVRRLYERLAQERTLVLYDSRGRGLSERNVTTFSLDTLVLDLAGVVDHLEIERFAMNATLNAGPPAIAYAVTYPERVSRLILLNSYSRGADYWDAPRQKAFRAMREADWPTFAETMARVFFGGAEFAPLIRELGERGNMVILGRGSQMILADHPTALHVLCVAPQQLRAMRLAEREGIGLEEANRRNR